jgi:hypothetical protein
MVCDLSAGILRDPSAAGGWPSELLESSMTGIESFVVSRGCKGNTHFIQYRKRYSDVQNQRTFQYVSTGI